MRPRIMFDVSKSWGSMAIVSRRTATRTARATRSGRHDACYTRSVNHYRFLWIVTTSTAFSHHRSLQLLACGWGHAGVHVVVQQPRPSTWSSLQGTCMLFHDDEGKRIRGADREGVVRIHPCASLISQSGADPEHRQFCILYVLFRYGPISKHFPYSGQELQELVDLTGTYTSEPTSNDGGVHAQVPGDRLSGFEMTATAPLRC